MKKVFSLGLLIAAMVLVTFSSCKPANTVKNVTGVKLSETTKSILVGGEFVLTATVSPTDAANKEVTWASDKADIATVDNNGKVKGVKDGEATITVTTKDGNKTDKCKVTVTNETTDPAFDEESKEQTTITKEWNQGFWKFGEVEGNVKSLTLQTAWGDDNVLSISSFYVDKNATKLTEGTYTVNDTKAVNTVLKSKGIVDKKISLSIVCSVVKKNDKYYVSAPFYFFDNGTVIVTAENITFNVKSHFGSTLNLKYTGSMEVPSGAPKKAMSPMKLYNVLNF